MTVAADADGAGSSAAASRFAHERHPDRPSISEIGANMLRPRPTPR